MKSQAYIAQLLPIARKDYILSELLMLKRKKIHDYITKGKTQRKNVP